MDQTLAQGRVISHTPGRLRVRVPPAGRDGQLARLQAGLADHPGIAAVETNAATGSVLVRYDPGVHSRTSAIRLLQAVGLEVAEGVATVATALPLGANSAGANSIITVLDDFDRRISRATAGRVDLKLLFPLGLGAIGVRQLLRVGLGLAEVPAYVLLWYAFDSFYKLHQARPVASEADGARAEQAPADASGSTAEPGRTADGAA